jgi:hypothetical protein
MNWRRISLAVMRIPGRAGSRKAGEPGQSGEKT